MPRFRPRRRVVVDLPDGFHLAEAPALQRAIVQALGLDASRKGPVPAELEVLRGAEGRFAFVWRRAYVGFAPHDREEQLGAVLDANPDVVVLVPGAVLDLDGTYRVWAGALPEHVPPVPAGLDELRPSELAIFGMPLNRLRTSHD